MKLKELLEGVRAVRIEGDTERDITGVNMDSRLVEPGGLFVAVKGTQADGPCLYRQGGGARCGGRGV